MFADLPPDVFWYLFETCVVDHPRAVARLATTCKATYDSIKAHAKRARRREYRLYQILQDVAAAVADRNIVIAIDEPRIVVRFGATVSLPWDREVIASVLRRALGTRFTTFDHRVAIVAPFAGPPPPSVTFSPTGSSHEPASPRRSRKVTVTFETAVHVCDVVCFTKKVHRFARCSDYFTDGDDGFGRWPGQVVHSTEQLCATTIVTLKSLKYAGETPHGENPSRP